MPTLTAIVQADGTWSADLPALVVGAHALTLRQTVGSSTSAPVAATLQVLDLLPTVDGIIGGARHVWSGSPLITGEAIPGATVTIETAEPPATTTAVVEPDGTWSAELPPLPVADIAATVRQALGAFVSGLMHLVLEVDLPVYGDDPDAPMYGDDPDAPIYSEAP